MNLIIAGSRSFNDYELLKKEVEKYIADEQLDELSVVCGMARGADLMGKRWAIEKGIPVIEKPADWETYGKRAGPLRNEEMARISHACIVFWDGYSPGSRNMMNVARAMKIPFKVVEY